MKQLGFVSVPVELEIQQLSSVADLGCLSRILDPNFFHPGSKFFSIPDPGSASKNLSILTQKIVLNPSEIWSGLFITNPDPDFLSIPNPGSGSRIRYTAIDARKWMGREQRGTQKQKTVGAQETEELTVVSWYFTVGATAQMAEQLRPHELEEKQFVSDSRATLPSLLQMW